MMSPDTRTQGSRPQPSSLRSRKPAYTPALPSLQITMYSFMGGSLFCAWVETILLVVATATDHWMQYQWLSGYFAHQGLWHYCLGNKCFLQTESIGEPLGLGSAEGPGLPQSRWLLAFKMEAWWLRGAAGSSSGRGQTYVSGLLSGGSDRVHGFEVRLVRWHLLAQNGVRYSSRVGLPEQHFRQACWVGGCHGGTCWNLSTREVEQTGDELADILGYIVRHCLRTSWAT